MVAQNGVSIAEAAAFADEDAIKFSASTAMNQIVLQKWIAGFLGDGWENWAEYRRTGFT